MRDPNLVQVEFFHENGSRFKTVIRFYDEQGTLSRYASLYRRIESVHHWAAEKYFAKRKKVYSIIAGLALRLKLRMHKKVLRLAGLCIRKAVQNGWPLAVEGTGHRFRVVPVSELRELLEIIGESTNLWVFVYGCTTLTADSVHVRASIM